MGIKTQDRVIPYIQPSGRGTALEPMSIKRHGLGDQTLGTIPGRGILFGRDDFGRPDPKVEFDEPPSGLDTATVTFDPEADLDFLDVMRRENGSFGVWNFYIPAGRLSNYQNWLNYGSLDFLAGCKISGGGKGGREKDFSGQPLSNTYDLSWRKTLELLPPKLTDASPSASETDQDINCIAMISDLDPNNEIPGYPGSDMILIAATDGQATAAADVLYSVSGGGSWGAFTAQPFAATGSENIKAIQVRMQTHNAYRMVVLRETADTANPCEIAYADVILGGEAGTITWTNVNLGSTNNEAGEALAWPFYGRLYAAAAGDIYVSTNQGVSFGTPAYSGSNAINDIQKDWDDNVWAVGAGNTILRESASNRGVFEGLVGPSGVTALYSVAVARDRWLFAGGDTSIYRSNNLAGNTGGWTELYDFGSNHSVKRIQCIDGESQLLRILVNDGTSNEGDVWYSLDGGNSVTEITDLANSGYNDWALSEVDPNLLYIAAEDDATNGVVHKLSTV